MEHIMIDFILLLILLNHYVYPFLFQTIGYYDIILF